MRYVHCSRNYIIYHVCNKNNSLPSVINQHSIIFFGLCNLQGGQKMNTLDNIYFEIEKAEDELKAIETMPEDKICAIYLVDSTEEAIKLINEDLTALRSELQTEIDRLESWD